MKSSEELGRESTFVVRNGVLTSRVGDEFVLLDCEADRYFALDAVGAFMFERVASGGSLGSVHDGVLEAYDASPDTAWQDLVTLVEDLVRRGVLSPTARTDQ